MSIPSQVAQRSLFSLSAFHITSDCVWLLLFGGTTSWNMDQLDSQQQRISQTVILEFSELNERTCKTIHQCYALLNEKQKRPEPSLD